MQTNTRPSVHLPVGALALLLFLGPAASLRAINYNWNNAAGGSFNDAANWTPTGGPPVAADNAYFKVAGTYSVALTGSPTIARLYFGDAFAGPQAVTFNGGTLSASYAYVGTGAGSANNRLTLDGATTSLSTSPAATWEDGIHIAGTGNSLTVSNGAGVSTTGMVSVAGTGGTLTVDGGTVTASGGTSRAVRLTGTNGLLAVLNGGIVTASGRYVIIGDGASASGATLNLSGGTVRGSRLYVGTGGASGGNATVTGASSLFESVSSGGLYVGDSSSNNTLTVSNGATAQAAGVVYVGVGTGSGNQVTVAGTGATLRGNQANDWVSSVEMGGAGNTLTVETGGVLTTGGGHVAIYGANNTLAVDGGSVTVNGTGRTGIGLNCNTYYGSTSGSGATLTMTAGTIATTGDIAVAGGSYTQTGGTATARSLLAGAYGANGSASTISGTGTILTASRYLHVGDDEKVPSTNSSNNSLAISNGAAASAQQVFIGSGTGTGNTLKVAGAGASLAASNPNDYQAGITLDGVGNTLEVGTGGSVTSNASQLQIIGTNNTVEIAGGNLAAKGIGINCNPYYRTTSGTGGSLIFSAGTIYSSNDLAVADGSYTQTGGTATVFRLLAGAFGANGTTTTISGPSARLSANTYITSNIIVGHDHSPGLGSANNTLRIENGASVDTLSGGIVGNSSGGGNMLVVSGPGAIFATGMNGQFWDSYLRVDPVGAGNNTVEVSQGGTLSVIGLSVGNAPGNAINNNGGVFEFRSDKGLCDPGSGGINLTNGTISYKNTNADVRFNNAAVYPSHPGNAWASGIADITFAGDNTFRMDNSSAVGYWDQTYTYDSLANTGNPRNYQKLELINGTVNIPLGQLTIGTGGAMLVDATAATVTQSVANHGLFELTDSATLAVGSFNQAAGSATLAGAISATTFAQSGGTTILDGTLAVVNPATISGGLLTGIGAITGSSLVANATVAPGSSPGILTFDGNATFADTTTLVFEIDGGGTAGLDYDQIVVTGNLLLADGVAVVFDLTRASRNQVLTLIDAGPGSTLGRLDYGGTLLEDGQAFAVGVYLLRIDYDTANGDVLLTVLIPEPSSLLLLAAAGLALRRRRARELAR